MSCGQGKAEARSKQKQNVDTNEDLAHAEINYQGPQGRVADMAMLEVEGCP